MYNDTHPIRALVFLGLLNALTAFLAWQHVIESAMFEATLFTSLGYAAGNTVLKRHNSRFTSVPRNEEPPKFTKNNP